MLAKIAMTIWGNKFLLVAFVASTSFGSAWLAKGILEEFECANEARVAALKIELANEKTISANNEKLRTAAASDIERLKAENQKRKERNNALIEQFKDSNKDGCSDFTNAELDGMRWSRPKDR